MPWRARYIVPRPHPLAIATYLLVFLLGVFFVLDVFDSTALNRVIGREWQYLWEWMMVIGGGTGIAGIYLRNDLEDGLLLECVGSGSSALGLGVYTLCIVDVFGNSSLVWLLFTVLGLGCVWRSVQAYRDRNLAIALGRRADAVLARRAAEQEGNES